MWSTQAAMAAITFGSMWPVFRNRPVVGGAAAVEEEVIGLGNLHDRDARAPLQALQPHVEVLATVTW